MTAIAVDGTTLTTDDIVGMFFPQKGITTVVFRQNGRTFMQVCDTPGVIPFSAINSPEPSGNDADAILREAETAGFHTIRRP